MERLLEWTPSASCNRPRRLASSGDVMARMRLVVDEVFQSYAQNGEDVVLWRALHNIPNGRYVDVGANDPSYLSITKAFYEHGWRGIAIEPSHNFAQLFRTQRPDDIVVEAAVASKGRGSVTLHEIEDSGLSTLRADVRDRHASHGWQVHEVEVPTKTLDEILEEADWAGLDIHFMTVDVEGAEGEVLASIDLERWRPWILVVEATEPLTTSPAHGEWEPQLLRAGYRFCLFDGLSRYYVAGEHADELVDALSYGPSVFDNFETYSQREVMGRLVTATENGLHWYAVAEAREPYVQRTSDLEAKLAAMEQSRSWRVTKPLRWAYGLRQRALAIQHKSGPRD